ncbi:type 1 fimbrial protein [Enterobacter bugandensis]|uniref:fimbrial protein n=1 Tax=Enterobacter bugandensis TaxID=881260 RepID=UPI001887E13F|nr:fimbrial protein [Enterobacter bugandensis]MBF2750900.1 type 1 fimbrial protein [Enterobacter bugandensis]MBF2803475.1 type 1 fimbrial protein [Enterobacter bugandensis]
MRKSAIPQLMIVFAGCVLASPLTFPVSAMPFEDYSGEAHTKWGGQAKFTGHVFSPACSLNMEDAWQSVDMGETPIRDLVQGIDGPQKILRLHLRDCELAGASQDVFTFKRMRITFEGVRGETHERFSVTGRAKGIDLQIFDSTGFVARAGKVMPALEIYGNEQALDYTFRLVRSTVPLSAGDYYAALRFKVDYE